jgi:hypothetical protein
MDPQMENVHTVDDYYDGRRSGIADLGGQPHFYRSLYLDNDTWDPDEDRFELSPVSLAVRDLAVEAFLLWQRWQVASFNKTARELDHDAPHVLPEDRARYEELESTLAQHFRIDPARRVVMRGEFGGRSAAGRPQSDLTVRWTSV